MDTNEAKAFATARFKELTKAQPSYTNDRKINVILRELHQKHNFDTLTFSPQHNGWVKVRGVELPSKDSPIMSYNIF